MKDEEIVVHDCSGKPLRINPDHIGARRAMDPAQGDGPKGKTVLEVDGVRHEVLESEAEIEALIAKL